MVNFQHYSTYRQVPGQHYSC